MHLYQGTSEQFIADAVQARLANQLAERFFQEFRYGRVAEEPTSYEPDGSEHLNGAGRRP